MFHLPMVTPTLLHQRLPHAVIEYGEPGSGGWQEGHTHRKKTAQELRRSKNVILFREIVISTALHDSRIWLCRAQIVRAL